MKYTDSLYLKVHFQLSLWSAIKMRIAGISTVRDKVTIEELIERKNKEEHAK